MRLSRGISQKRVADACRCSEASIGHYETGRMDISAARLESFVRYYGYTMAEFGEYMAGKAIPIISIKDECICLLDRIGEAKLRDVHAVLEGFVS